MCIAREGRITVLAEACEQASLLPGTEGEFTARRGVVEIQKAGKPPTCRGPHLIVHLRDKATRHMSTDEILALTRG